MEVIVWVLVFFGVLYVVYFRPKRASVEDSIVYSAKDALHRVAPEYSNEAEGSYKIYVMPTIKTRLRILRLRNNVYNSRAKAERERAETGEGHIAYIGGYGEERSGTWTDAGIMYDEEVEEYYKYLEKVRSIYEEEGTSDTDKIRDITLLSNQSDMYRKFHSNLNDEYGAYPSYLFFRELTKVNGIGNGTAQTIYHSGITSLNQLRQSTDKELNEIPGVGKKTITQIRNYFKTWMEIEVDNPNN